MPVGRPAPSAATVQASVSTQPNVGGRPAKVTPTYLPLRGGGGAINPQVMAMANEYIKSHQMPPGLQPKRSRPIQNRTNQAISKGFTKKGPPSGT